MPKAHKWVYQFTEGSAKMRDLLGGKGAGAAEMTRAGMPVPPGFTITTEACRAYYASGGKFPKGLWEQVLAGLKVLERKAGKKLGDPIDPLLVSVRSGAKFSMPGMMDTVLNLGLNEDTAKGLALLTKDERFALDARRRFIQMFGKTVKGIDGEKFEDALQEAKKKAGVKTDPELKPEHLGPLVARFLAIYKEETRRDFPSDPVEQLREAIDAVFKSWNTDRAKTYRRMERIPDDLGIAVDMVKERLITRKEAVARVEPRQLEQLLFPRDDPAAKVSPLARGVPASPGAASGGAVFDADTAVEWGKQGKAVILVRVETNPNDVHGMVEAKGILTQTGGTASHAALVARGMGRPCGVGASSIDVDVRQRQFSANGTTITA